MKKKFFAVALATTMALSTALTGTAATADVDITGGLGSGNTGDEAVTGDFDVSYTFKNASHDASANWNNFAVEVVGEGYGITARADAFAVGFNGAEAVLGGWGDNPIPASTTWTGQPEDWAVWAAGMADATVDVNVKRSGNVLTLTYKINAGGQDYTFVGTTPEVPGMPDALNIHLTGEKVALSNVKFTDNKAGGAATPEPDSKPSTDPTTAASGGDTPTTKAPAATTAGKTTPKTGDVAPVAALAAVAVVACAAVVVSKKKVTE